jgi:hypothetical protein
MRELAAGVVFVVLSGIAQAQAQVQELGVVPWSEFKPLFRESIEREVLQARCEDSEETPFVCHLAEGVYQLEISRERVQGTARIAGLVLSGKPQPIPLFGRDMVISEVVCARGGSLLSGQDEEDGIQFLPAGGTNAFEVSVSFFVRVREEDRSSAIAFAIPPALQNSLTLKLPDALKLVEAPGITDEAGVYHFAASRSLGVRFAAKAVSGTNTIDVSGLSLADAAPVVLDSQDFFTSFDENGSILSVMVMDVPASAGPHLRIAEIPDVEVWSLTVNGTPRNVYRDTGSWIIPLENEGSSRVQLALLRQAGKLGLQGHLETFLPSTGLPSRTLRVGMALPPRVQLLALDGPVSPASGEAWVVPADFIGNPHFFSRAFYKGEGMKLAVSYKEPVKQAK